MLLCFQAKKWLILAKCLCSLRQLHFSYLCSSLKLYFVVAKQNNCHVPSYTLNKVVPYTRLWIGLFTRLWKGLYLTLNRVVPDSELDDWMDATVEVEDSEMERRLWMASTWVESSSSRLRKYLKHRTDTFKQCFGSGYFCPDADRNVFVESGSRSAKISGTGSMKQIT